LAYFFIGHGVYYTVSDMYAAFALGAFHNFQIWYGGQLGEGQLPYGAAVDRNLV